MDAGEGDEGVDDGEDENDDEPRQMDLNHDWKLKWRYQAWRCLMYSNNIAAVYYVCFNLDCI